MLSSKIPFVCGVQIIINSGLVSEKGLASLAKHVRAAAVVEEN